MHACKEENEQREWVFVNSTSCEIHHKVYRPVSNIRQKIMPVFLFICSWKQLHYAWPNIDSSRNIKCPLASNRHITDKSTTEPSSTRSKLNWTKNHRVSKVDVVPLNYCTDNGQTLLHRNGISHRKLRQTYEGYPAQLYKMAFIRSDCLHWLQLHNPLRCKVNALPTLVGIPSTSCKHSTATALPGYPGCL